MRVVRHSMFAVIAGVAAMAVACSNNDTTTSGSGVTLQSPDSLTYQLTAVPAGVLLSWMAPADSSLVSAFAVYGRDSSLTNTSWNQIAITVSSSFHLTAPIDTEYYVTSEDVYGDQSAPSATLVINYGDSVQTPGDLRGTPYNGAVTVGWDSIAQVGYNASRFQYYNVYSMPYTGSACDTTSLSIEGTTVSTAFVITGLTDGVARCYTVTSVSLSGEESPFGSPFVTLTPSSSDPAFTASLVPAGTLIVAEHRRPRHRVKT